MKSMRISGKNSNRPSKLVILALSLAASGILTEPTRAANETWTGGVGGTGTDFGLATNWTNNTAPTANGDTGTLNGTATGTLSLLYTTGFAGSSTSTGFTINLDAGQTSPVTIDSGTSTTSLRFSGITIASGAGAFTLGNGSDTFNITLGSSTNDTATFTNDSAHTATFKSDIATTAGGGGSKNEIFGGAGNWDVQNSMVATSLRITKVGSGTLSLSGSNSYTGVTTVQAGTLVMSSSNAVSNTGVLVGGTNGSSNATLYNAGFTVTNTITVQTGNTGLITIGGNAANSSTYTGKVLLGTASSMGKDVTFVAAAGGTVAFSGIIDQNTSSLSASNVTVGDANDTGTVVFSNTANGYTGVTTINGGTLSVTKLANGHAGSSIGSSGAAGTGGSPASDLVINGGILQYIGAGNTTNRLFTIGTNGATIDASGASNAALSFTGTGLLVAAGTGDRTLTFTGASTGTNTMVSVIADPSSGKTGVTKTGAGSWTLAGVNTYTGTTTVSAGTLILSTSGSSNIAHSSAIDFTSSGSGTLNVTSVAGGFQVVAGQTIKGTGTVIGNTTITGTLAPGNSAGTLTFNNNLTLNGTAKMELVSAGTRGTAYDAVNVAGSLTYGGVLTLDLTGAGTNRFAEGTVFDLFTPGSVTGDLASINILGASSPYFGLTFTEAGSGALGLWTSTADGNGQYFTFSQGSGDLTVIGAVPEPKVAMLLGIGIVAICLRSRQRRSCRA